MSTATMARPRGAGRRKGAVGDPANRPVPSPSFSMKGDPEWVAWVDALADFLKSTKADAVDQGLVLLARSRGFDRMPPPRFKK